MTLSEIPNLSTSVANLGQVRKKVFGVEYLSGRRQVQGKEGTRMVKIGLRNGKKV